GRRRLLGGRVLRRRRRGGAGVERLADAAQQEGLVRAARLLADELGVAGLEVGQAERPEVVELGLDGLGHGRLLGARRRAPASRSPPPWWFSGPGARSRRGRWRGGRSRRS